MANRTFSPAFSYGFGRVTAEFQFTTNGASAPLLTSVDGADIVASFAHTGGTNAITVTLKDAFNKCISALADTRETTGDRAKVSSVSSEGTSTPISLTIHYFVAAGTARNDPNGVLTNVMLAFRNSNGGSFLK